MCEFLRFFSRTRKSMFVTAIRNHRQVRSRESKGMFACRKSSPEDASPVDTVTELIEALRREFAHLPVVVMVASTCTYSEMQLLHQRLP